MTPRPGGAPAAIATKPFALRAQAFASTAAVLLSAGRSGNINTNNNRREVGPLQASAVGPLQTATATPTKPNLGIQTRLYRAQASPIAPLPPVKE